VRPALGLLGLSFGLTLLGVRPAHERNLSDLFVVEGLKQAAHATMK